MEECKKVPTWVEHFLFTTFFMVCGIHIKNECNKYCIDCMGEAFCPDCIPTDHKEHHVIQVRRSSYHDCIRVVDIHKDLDLGGIQEFVINSAKVVFLNKRGRYMSQAKPTGGSAIRNNTSKSTMIECMTCERPLNEPFCFCSIQCKFECIRKNESGCFFLSVKKEKEGQEMKGMHEEMATLPSDGKEKKVMEEGSSREVSQTEVSQTMISPNPDDKPIPRPVNYNSRKRKGIPRRAPFF